MLRGVIRILGISGSLRAVSANSNLLRAAAVLAPEDVRVTLYQGLAALPHFNPDVEAVSLPAPVADWRAQVGAANAILISSPSLVATHAQASLLETLTTMAANVVAAACVTIPVAGKNLEVARIVGDPELAAALRSPLAALTEAVVRA